MRTQREETAHDQEQAGKSSKPVRPTAENLRTRTPNGHRVPAIGSEISAASRLLKTLKGIRTPNRRPTYSGALCYRVFQSATLRW